MSEFTRAVGCTSPCCYPLTTGVSGCADRGFTVCAARGHADALSYFEDIFFFVDWIVLDCARSTKTKRLTKVTFKSVHHNKW